MRTHVAKSKIEEVKSRIEYHNGNKMKKQGLN